MRGCLRYGHLWRGLNRAHRIISWQVLLLFSTNWHLRLECLLLHLVDGLGLEEKFGWHVMVV